jgi:hypothetical protein
VIGVMGRIAGRRAPVAFPNEKWDAHFGNPMESLK